MYEPPRLSRQLSDQLTQLLGLERPPIGIWFREAPNGVKPLGLPMSAPTADGRTGTVAASCVFWMHATEKRFSTLPAEHGNCSVGRFVHGLAEVEEIVDKSDIGALLDVGWVTMETFAGIARVDQPVGAIEYGPLHEFDNLPTVALLFVNPAQMMAIADAVPVEFTDKPQCQLIPRTIQTNSVTASMGCALSRERTGLGVNEMTCAIAGDRLLEFISRLENVTRTDGLVASYARDDAARF